MSPQRLRLGSLVAAVGLAALVGGCGSDDEPTATASPTAKNATHRDFDRGNFSASTTIDNEWNPLVPGTQFIYEGRSDRGEGRRAHRVVFTVTDLTKVIDGVRAVVLWDRDINAGQLLEAELAFHAQDDDGNVWNMGEYPEEREPGEQAKAPDAWLSGLGDARAGVLMRADPQTGTSKYRQGFVPSIEFGDLATVFRTGVRDCVPTGCYEDVLVTDETNPYEAADGHQRKYYASGVGNIRAAPKGGKEKEVLVLGRVRKLGPKAIAKVRGEALKLERNAYRVRTDLWGKTEPAQR